MPFEPPSALEAAANLMNTVSIVLAGRNSIHTWWTGIVGCLLFALVFVGARLYADATLQCFFVATSLLGWLWWRARADAQPRPITWAPRRWMWTGLALSAAVVLGYGSLLHLWTDAYAPFADSAVLALSVLAQWLLMRRHVQTWPLWLGVNLIAVPLFASRGLWLTAALYTLYGVNAVVSWWHWSRLVRKPAPI